MPVINTNVGSLLGVVHVSRTEKALNEASERLSSGKKLVGAADDAAGLAISTRMTANIKSLNMAVLSLLISRLSQLQVSGDLASRL